MQLAEDIDLEHIAEKYELTGSNIMNIVQHTCLQALNDQTKIISKKNLLNGIAREFIKEGKIL